MLILIINKKSTNYKVGEKWRSDATDYDYPWLTNKKGGELFNVLLANSWALYYSHWTHLGPRRWAWEPLSCGSLSSLQQRNMSGKRLHVTSLQSSLLLHSHPPSPCRVPVDRPAWSWCWCWRPCPGCRRREWRDCRDRRAYCSGPGTLRRSSLKENVWKSVCEERSITTLLEKEVSCGPVRVVVPGVLRHLRPGHGGGGAARHCRRWGETPITELTWHRGYLEAEVIDRNNWDWFSPQELSLSSSSHQI